MKTEAVRTIRKPDRLSYYPVEVDVTNTTNHQKRTKRIKEVRTEILNSCPVPSKSVRVQRIFRTYTKTRFQQGPSRNGTMQPRPITMRPLLAIAFQVFERDRTIDNGEFADRIKDAITANKRLTYPERSDMIQTAIAVVRRADRRRAPILPEYLDRTSGRRNGTPPTWLRRNHGTRDRL